MGSSTASRTGRTASAGAPQVGAARIKAAFALLGVLTVEVAVLAATAVPVLLADANGTGSRLRDAGVGWPLGALLAAVGAVLTVAAVWRGWALVSVRFLLAATVAWSAAGARILTTGGTASVLFFAGVALALVATVAWGRGRSGSRLQ